MDALAALGTPIGGRLLPVMVDALFLHMLLSCFVRALGSPSGESLVRQKIALRSALGRPSLGDAFCMKQLTRYSVTGR